MRGKNLRRSARGNLAIFAAVGIVAVAVVALIVFLIAPVFTLAAVALIGGLVIAGVPPYPLPKEIVGGALAAGGLILGVVAVLTGAGLSL